MKHRFLTAAMLAAAGFLPAQTPAAKGMVCLHFVYAYAPMQIRIAAEKPEYNSEWSRTAGSGDVRCADTAHVPRGVKHRAEVKIMDPRRGDKFAQCPPGTDILYVYSFDGDTTCERTYRPGPHWLPEYAK